MSEWIGMAGLADFEQELPQEKPIAEPTPEVETPAEPIKPTVTDMGQDDTIEMQSPLGTQLDIRVITTAYNDNCGSYCPVYVASKPEGGKIFSAYISEQILDLDCYIDLIDTLFSAGPEDDYYIYIDSPGGFVSSGSIIASAIHHSRANVYTIARGLCASAAALIHNSAKPGHAKMANMSMLMIHMSSHGDMGLSTRIATNAENQVRYVNENLLKQARDLGYITPEELTRIQGGDEIFITAKQFRERVAASQSNNQGE